VNINENSAASREVIEAAMASPQIGLRRGKIDHRPWARGRRFPFGDEAEISEIVELGGSCPIGRAAEMKRVPSWPASGLVPRKTDRPRAARFVEAARNGRDSGRMKRRW